MNDMYDLKLKRYIKSLHFHELRQIILEDENRFMWMPLKTINCEMDFERYLEYRFNGYYHDFFMIMNAKDQSIGFVYSHDFYANDGHTMFTIVVKDRYQGQGYGAVASIMFLDYMFKTYNLRKIFTSVYEYNTLSMNTNISGGFTPEGVLKEYRYYNNRYYDLNYSSISRDVFYQKHNKTLSYLTKKQLRNAEKHS